MSSESDFCSSCGAAIDAGAGASTGAGAPLPLVPVIGGGSQTASSAGEHCPKCSSERDDPSSPFCGTCGYNFVTKQGGDVLPPEEVAPPVPIPAVNTPAAPFSSSAPIAGARMDITITVDFSKANAPKVRPSLKFPLFDEESLIGRSSSSLKQTVAIEDEAISKRHALIVRNADGSYSLRDLNSTNGTALNGTPLIAGADHPLKEGDVVTMGEFTVITITAIRQS